MNLFAALWSTPDENSHQFLGHYDVTDSATFGTQLHGGFSTCTFTATDRIDISVRNYRLWLGAHVVIFDSFGKRVWEGDVDKTGMNDTRVSVTALGYYAKGKRLFFDNIYPAVEGTQNLIRNPSFEVNVTDSWTFAGGTGGSVARSTAKAKVDTASALITQPTAGADSTFKTTITVTGGEQYTLTFYALDSDLSNTPYIKIVENDGGATTTQNTIYGLSKSVFVRYELKVTLQPSTTSVDITWGVAPNENAGSFYLDACQFEHKPYSTTYADGAQGLYHSWDGTAHNSTSTRASFSYTTYDIVKDIVDFMSDYWQTAYAMLSRAVFKVGNQDFTGKKVNDALENVLRFGYTESDLRPLYFAIWENRIPILFPEPEPWGWPDWKVSVNSITGGSLQIEQSLEGVYNRVYAVYDNIQGGVSLTLPADNTFSQSRFGIIEGKVQNGTTPEGIALANDLRDMAVQKFSYPRQIYSLEVKGLIKNAAENLDYPYRMRAGQRILITDVDFFTPLATDIQSQESRGLSALIMKTNYTSSSRSMQIDLGLGDVSFETLMSRLGLSGGLT